MSDVDKLWLQYSKNKSKTIKDKLLVEYASLVKYTAQRISYNLPASVELDDLISSGILGLIKAVETFDLERGFKFETFATHKIRGAILDELRSLDWVPRSVRQKTRQMQRAYTKLQEELGRMPYDDEVAEELNVSMDEFGNLLSDVSPTAIISLEDSISGGADGDSKTLTIIDTIEDPGGVNPLKDLGFAEVKNILKESIIDLPEKEKLVVALYHYEELTLKEIGEVLSVSESRVSQIHSKAILKLRSRLLSRIGI